MKTVKLRYLTVAAFAAITAVTACKTKKALPKPPEQTETAAKPLFPPVEEKKADAAPTSTSTDAVAPVYVAATKPDYKFANLQFEFNSAILKTTSYPMLDKVAMEMKTDGAVKFRLNGYASAEGTPAHNMELSEQRASAVKTYLLNAGVTEEQMTAKGFGENNPIKPNTTEDNRALNRRVEIRKL